MSSNPTKNPLHEFETIGYDITKLKPYSDFLGECLNKDYTNCVTQLHHILPKSMNDGVYAQETIRLSLLDHFNAHHILASCFDVGTSEKQKNLSACKYIKVHIKRYMTKSDHAIPDDLGEFWSLADEIMKDFNKGENNLFYGKTHTEETRKIIKAKRKLQVFTEEQKKFHGDRLKQLPTTQKGEANPNFGKTFDEIHGIEKSAEIRQKLKDAIARQNENRQLPEGLHTYQDSDDGRTQVYRNCPTINCDNIIVYRYSTAQNRQSVKLAETTMALCPKCRISKRYGDEIVVPERTVDHTVSSRLIIQDVETGVIYNSVMDARRALNLRDSQMDKLRVSGRFVILENTSRHKNCK